MAGLRDLPHRCCQSNHLVLSRHEQLYVMSTLGRMDDDAKARCDAEIDRLSQVMSNTEVALQGGERLSTAEPQEVSELDDR